MKITIIIILNHLGFISAGFLIIQIFT